MEKKIEKYLSDLEAERGIEILLACETGSRAWGFPSPDSDYDVRIIYRHELDWYLRLTEGKDSIEAFFENNDIDISGWDLRKCLRLLKKSNAALLERIQSPIVYRKDAEFMEAFTTLAKTGYSRIATMHHYLSMAKNGLTDLADAEEYKLKKFFYALRASTASLWILQKDEMPPIEFKKMIAGLDLPTSLVSRINELIEIKARVSEAYLHQGEAELFAFMHDCVQRAKASANQLPSSKVNTEEFNTFFISTVKL